MLRNLTKTLVVVVSSTILATLAVYAVDLRDQYYHTTMLSGLVFSTQENTVTCPENMVYVSQALNPFCIDKYEASAGFSCMYENPKNNTETTFNISNTKCVPETVAQRVPWRNITLAQAQEACEKAGKRLASPNEWFIAAFGTPDQKNGWSEEQCNVANNRADGISKTGSGMRCISNIGAYDMIGNAWEWVEGIVHQGTYNDTFLPQTGFVTGVSINGLANTTGTAKDENYYNDRFWVDNTLDEAGIMRGGYFGSEEYAGLYATYAASPVTFSGDALGFRCVKTVNE